MTFIDLTQVIATCLHKALLKRSLLVSSNEINNKPKYIDFAEV